MNRVEREAKVIAAGFDELCAEHVAEIDQIYGAVSALVIAGLKNAEENQDHLREVLATVLSNALKSFTASFSLLRTGWRLQPYQTIRNCMEALSVALHLFMQNEDLAKFERDKLKTTETFKSAEKLMPPFSRIWGHLSGDFSHIGRPFRFIQSGTVYRADEQALWHALGVQMSVIWLAYQVSELVFLNTTAEPLFWKRVGEREYLLQRTPEAVAWQKKLVSRYKEFITGDASKSDPKSDDEESE